MVARVRRWWWCREYGGGDGAGTLLLKKIGQKCEIGEEDGGGVAAFEIGG